MKYFLIILLVVIIISFVYIRSVINKFIFGDVKFVGGDIKSILSGSSFTAINLSETITNNNGFSVPVSGLYVELFYGGSLIGQSTAPQADFTIPAHGNLTLNQSMTVNISSGISIAAKVLSGTPVVFDYTVKAKLFGFYPLTYNGTFTY